MAQNLPFTPRTTSGYNPIDAAWRREFRDTSEDSPLRARIDEAMEHLRVNIESDPKNRHNWEWDARHTMRNILQTHLEEHGTRMAETIVQSHTDFHILEENGTIGAGNVNLQIIDALRNETDGMAQQMVSWITNQMLPAGPSRAG